MNELLYRITSLIISAVSLTTATGVFMHDMRVDKALSLSLENAHRPAPATASVHTSLSARLAAFLHADAHTHPDFKPTNSLMKGFAYPSPSVPPREREHINRNLLRQAEPRGRHAFDNYNLPVLQD